MAIRERITEIRSREDDLGCIGQVWNIWDGLNKSDACPFCGCDVPLAEFPWRYRRHDVYGMVTTVGPASLCVGSRNVFTLDVLGLGSRFA